MDNFLKLHWFKVGILILLVGILGQLLFINMKMESAYQMQEYFMQRQDTNIGALVEYILQFEEPSI